MGLKKATSVDSTWTEPPVDCSLTHNDMMPHMSPQTSGSEFQGTHDRSPTDIQYSAIMDIPVLVRCTIADTPSADYSAHPRPKTALSSQTHPTPSRKHIQTPNPTPSEQLNSTQLTLPSLQPLLALPPPPHKHPLHLPQPQPTPQHPPHIPPNNSL